MSEIKYQLKILEVATETLGAWFEFTLTDVRTKEIIIKDSINDVGQSIEQASKQITAIIQHKLSKVVL